MTDSSSPPVRQDAGTRMRRMYVKVLIVWAVVLAALFLFQEYFS